MRIYSEQRARWQLLMAELEIAEHQSAPVTNMAEWENKHDRLEKNHEEAERGLKQARQEAWNTRDRIG